MLEQRPHAGAKIGRAGLELLLALGVLDLGAQPAMQRGVRVIGPSPLERKLEQRRANLGHEAARLVDGVGRIGLHPRAMVVLASGPAWASSASRRLPLDAGGDAHAP